MKKFIKPIAIYTGTFVFLNVGMYFLLRMTQPKSEVLSALQSDSTASVLQDSTITAADHDDAHSSAKVDSIAVDGTASHSDSAGIHAHSDEATGTSDKSTPNESAKHGGQTEVGSENAATATADGSGNDVSVADEMAEDRDSESVLTETPKSTAEIAKLAKLLEGMKPDEAAVIAERLPTETIVQLVMRMKSRSGAKMMASLPVPIAASVATKMAELSGVKSPS